MSATPKRPRLIVVGGGLSGLAAAYHARECAGNAVEVGVIEASERVGGVVSTERTGDFLIEGGPDSMVTDKPEAMALCRRLGLEEEIIPTQEQFRRTLIVRDGHLCPMPEGFQLMAPSRLTPFLLSPILSWRGRLRALKDLILPRGGPPPGGDESLADFVRRRLGNEILERIAQPMIGGIYTADPEKLSLASTMPRFLDMEREYRSLLVALAVRARGAAAEAASGPRYGLFASLRGGIGRLVEELVAQLPPDAIRYETPVAEVARSEAGKWHLRLANGENESADAIILATPAPKAAAIVGELDPGLARDLADIEYSSAAIVSLAFRRSECPEIPRAFGFVVPFIEGRNIIAGSFPNVKFVGRAPEDHLLVRAFVGGSLQPEILENDDRTLCDLARKDLADLLGIHCQPTLTRVKRWPDSTLAKFEKAWFEVVKEETAKDPLFKKVADHFYGFRAKYKVWGDAQSLDNTYIK